jgi:hypothetical protein
MLGVRHSVPDSGTNDVRIQGPLTFTFSSKEYALVSTLRDDVCVFITAGPSTKLFAWGGGDMGGHVLLCLLLQYLVQSCARGGRRIVEDMCYEIRRAQACVD